MGSWLEFYREACFSRLEIGPCEGSDWVTLVLGKAWWFDLVARSRSATEL